MEPVENAARDPVVEQLADLFRAHPAWVRAARKLDPEATSTVFFRHRPGEAWRLERREGVTRLLSGAAADPDFVFCFNAAAVEGLAAVEGELVGDFAVELFRLMTDPPPEERVGFRIATSFSRLVHRGYLSLLAAGGWRVLAFGATRGVRTLAQLRALVETLRRSEPEDWERLP